MLALGSALAAILIAIVAVVTFVFVNWRRRRREAAAAAEAAAPPVTAEGAPGAGCCPDGSCGELSPGE